MVQIMAWPLSVFLSLTILYHDVNFVVNAYATRIRTRSPFSYTHGRAMMWSSSKASVLKDKLYAKTTTTDEESSSRKRKISEEPLEPIEAATIVEVADDESEKDNFMNQIKESGVAGVISYASWELAFWTVSVPVCVFGYKEVTGHWPDLKSKDDLSKLGAEAFAFVNFARFAVPLRIGLALGTTPWIQENIVDVFLIDKDTKDGNSKDEEVVVKLIEESDHPDDAGILKSTKESEDADDSNNKSTKESEDADDSNNKSTKESEDADDSNNKSTKESEDADDSNNKFTKESEDADDSNNKSMNNNEEENINYKGSRFRIRSRVRNLINRVLRRKNQ